MKLIYKFLSLALVLTIGFSSLGQLSNNLIANDSTVTWVDGSYINQNTGVSTPLNAYSHTDTIDISPDQEYTLRIGGYGVAWYDQVGTFISVSGGSSEPVRMRTIISPSGAEYCIANYLTSYKQEFRIFEGTDFYYKDQIGGLDIPNGDRYWANKKIAWYGTSIPAGFPNQSDQWNYAYPNIVAKNLGADCDNYSVSAGQIRLNNTSGTPVFFPQSFSSSSLTNTNYTTKIVNLIGTELEPDLFVIDYGVNDYANDPTDIDNVAAYDFTSTDTNTFLGSYNSVLRELFTAKPTAKVMLVTHYSDDGEQVAPYNTKDCWKPLNDLIVKIGEYWNVPVLDLRKVSGMRNANGIGNINLYCPDLIHPASDSERLAVNQIARLCESFILNNIPTETTQAIINVPTPPTPPIPSSIIRSTALLMQTGQPLSFITGDAADVVYGRADDFLTLDAPPVHNNGSATINTTNFRFTDEFGGQDFITGIVLDWSSWDGYNVIGFQNNFILTPNYTPLIDALSFSDSFTLGGFSGWHQANFNELFAVSMKKYHPFDYPPFNYSGVNLLWTSNTLSPTVAIALRLDTFDPIPTDLNANGGRPFPCRIFTLIGTTLF